MQHARPDYNHIQEMTAEPRIPADEPVFLIRGQDIVAGDAVRAWADLAEQRGADPDIVQTARAHAARMDAWGTKKTPDMAPQESPSA